MKYSYFIIISLFIFFCWSPKCAAQDKGKVTIEKTIGNIDSTTIEGNIYELSTGDNLKLSDIWIDDKRYQCDTNGHFQLKINPGKYNIEARAFGFKNYKYKLTIKKSEILNLSFFLVPYKNEKPYKRIH